MAIRKIELMHRQFGQADGYCKNCNHLVTVKHQKKYRKCKVYGVNTSISTDWNQYFIACGLYPGKPYAGKDVVSLVTREKKNLNEQIEGQIALTFD